MVGQPRDSPGSYALAVVCVAWPVRVARVGGVGTALRVDAVDRNSGAGCRRKFGLLMRPGTLSYA